MVTSDTIDLQKEAIKVETRKMKKPTKEEKQEYSKIRAEIKIKYSNKLGNVPRGKINDFNSELFESSTHIFNAEQVEAYKSKKKLEKLIRTDLSILAKLDRIEIMYEVGYLSAKAIYFGCFMDFRTRVYAEGWPIGMQNGYFKHLLQVSKASKVSITNRNTNLFKSF